MSLLTPEEQEIAFELFNDGANQVDEELSHIYYHHQRTNHTLRSRSWHDDLSEEKKARTLCLMSFSYISVLIIFMQKEGLAIKNE